MAANLGEASGITERSAATQFTGQVLHTAAPPVLFSRRIAAMHVNHTIAMIYPAHIISFLHFALFCYPPRASYPTQYCTYGCRVFLSL